MVALRESTSLANDLEGLAQSLAVLELAVESSLGSERDFLVRTIRSYLIPRLMTPGRPLTVVFAGPTGSGKSTLVNSLSGLEVSKTGPIRPTTKEPVVLASSRYAGEMSKIGDVDCHVVVGSVQILDQVSLVDTPDIDSTVRSHRVTAETLIDHADVVVFVTSALRYADAVPWEILRRAQSRGAPLLFVLNRLSPDLTGAHVDFTARLRDAGLDQQVLRVPEHHLGETSQAVPALAVRELRRTLENLARGSVAQSQEILDRVLRTTISRTSELIAEADDLSATREIGAESVRAVFAGRLGGVELSESAPPMAVGAPGGRSRLASWRWRRVNRLNSEAKSELLAATEEAAIRVLESDIGQAAIETGADPVTVMSGARPVLREAVAGWVDGLDVMVERLPERDRPLAQVVLAKMVLAGSDSRAGSALFGIDRDLIVGSSRKALLDRIEVAYTHASELASSGDAGGDLDTKPVGDRLAAAVVRSHFADA